MKINFSHPFFWFGIGILFILFIHLVVSQFDTIDQELNNAAKAYASAEVAENLKDREEGFNQSLSIYKKLETEYAPTAGNGKLYFDIANNYFQLGEYPMAIAYFLHAEELMPRSEKVKSNLIIAYDKLGIHNEKIPSIFEKIFFFHYKLSLPEKLQLFFVLATLLFILASCQIWSPFFGLKTLIFIVTACLLILFCSIFYTQFITPSYGVILKSNELYKDAGLQYSKVLTDPVPSGTKVTVLQILQNGQWIKIETPNGTQGYIPFESLEILDK